MSTTELSKKLIERIQKIDNDNLLKEAYRLFELESEEIEVYKLTDEQQKAVREGQHQIQGGHF